MLNLFITYNCNFHCDYCFVRGFGKKYPMYLEEEKFIKLCEWLKKNKVYSIGILGGEPTTHPKIVTMLKTLNEYAISPVLFTNGLFPKVMQEELAEYAANFVINYNDPKVYTEELWEHLHENIKGLKKLGARISFSKNFSRGTLDFNYLLEGAKKYGITNIRYDISRPSPLEANNYFNLDDTKMIIENIISFVKNCENEKIKTGLDCCVPFCYFDQQSLQYMKTVSTKFTGICHPSIDIQTDLSATYCIPMQQINVSDVTKFYGEIDLLGYLSNKVKKLRFEKKQKRCEECSMFGVQCQGGCLALKQALCE